MKLIIAAKNNDYCWQGIFRFFNSRKVDFDLISLRKLIKLIVREMPNL